MARSPRAAKPHQGSAFLRHVACPQCGSKDNNAEYTDGHTYCFGCAAHVGGLDASSIFRPPPVSGMISGEFKSLYSRKVSEETCKHFGYMVGTYKHSTVQIAPYYDGDGRLVAQKLRFPDKNFVFLGEPKSALPFGSHVWQKTGKKIVVTEGEVDALSMSQVQGNKWPVVSIGCGAGPQIRKYFAKHRDYFSGFEEVVLMFDMDEAGREAMKEAASVLGSRARIADLPLKDVSDMLKAGRTAELIDAMWKAREYRPEGIVDMADLKEAVKARPALGLSWPFRKLTEMTYGIRTGELYGLGAGTGIGKTDFFTQTMMHFVIEHQVPIGVFSLEQSPTETATRIAGKVAGQTFHIPDSGWIEADLDRAWTSLMASGKVFLYDSFGQNDWNIVREKIEYLFHAHGVRYFFLDHLTALAAWQDDERKELEMIMSEMGALVKKLDIAVFFISHLATPEGKPHEEGGRVMLRHLKGSRSIVQWAHYVIGLERNQQDDSEAVRTTTIVRMLKDRYTGRSTGQTFHIGYDQYTGLLYETSPPDPNKAKDFGFVDAIENGGAEF